MREIGREMFEKFEKYWGENSLLIAIASVLDPWFKLKLVEFSFAKLYSKAELNDRVKEVLNKLQTLFEIYSKEYVSSFSSPIISADVSTDVGMEIEEEYFTFLKSTVSKPAIKSDLEIYLEEPVLLKFDEFDVLDWWKVNNIKYPVLSKLARDILCIPFSVPFGAAFEAGERVLNDYKSALSNELLEVLVCGGDWIRAGTESESQISNQADIEEEEENLEVRIMQDDKEEENPEIQIQIQEDEMEE
ncbi:hypothetical protein LUZ60_014033 [Juncus effusus]|nr:hypothetical protein LUZ60_014033 [Juncus effusus]